MEICLPLQNGLAYFSVYPTFFSQVETLSQHLIAVAPPLASWNIANREKNFMVLKKIDIDKITSEVNERGYTVARNVIEQEFITRQRNRWTSFFSAKPKTRNFVWAD